MRVLVTGAGGFLGRALIPRLAEQGHEVFATDRDGSGLGDVGAGRATQGDICDPDLRGTVLEGAEAVIHLASIPGGAAEQDPNLARRINVEAGMALSAEFATRQPRGAFVFASSIAVFGDPLPPAVDDATPLAPRMLYGAHKAMLEAWLATLGRRGSLTPLSVRFSGIVARPAGSSGLKSAFMSELFHALAANRAIEVPVSCDAAMWLMSVRQAAASLAHALDAARAELPLGRAMTLPALHVSMNDLVTEIARQCGVDASVVAFAPDPAIERGFGAQPPLTTLAADRLGFSHDGDLTQLVRSALQDLH